MEKMPEEVIEAGPINMWAGTWIDKAWRNMGRQDKSFR